jgi:hypothetical protein
MTRKSPPPHTVQDVRTYIHCPSPLCSIVHRGIPRLITTVKQLESSYVIGKFIHIIGANKTSPFFGNIFSIKRFYYDTVGNAGNTF